MPQVCREGDVNTAGGAVISGTIATVTVEGRAVAVVGSVLSPDINCPDDPVHCAPVIVQGSSTVTAGGIPIAFVGSATSCGHPMASGAATVEVGI
jgi:uncharacterized Zn-binding protein involved in type VI secretion